ncbi:hypothetical protein SSCG_03716 [Streptomyces clavuligerus]|nr:hypothetical protein SSCG_03716 [Streptomyces clavuligerus]
MLALPGVFVPVGVAGTTLHDLRRHAKSIPHTPSDLRKRAIDAIIDRVGATQRDSGRSEK